MTRNRTFLPSRQFMLLLLVMPIAQLRAQVRILFPERTACAACRLEVVRTGTLAALKNEGTLPGRPYPSTLARASTGRWYVGFPEVGEEPIQVFGPDRRFSGNLGAIGKGPAEYQDVGSIRILPGDSILVYDKSSRLATVYTADGRAARTQRIPGDVWDLLPLAGGVVVVSATIATPDRVGLPLHLVDKNGTLTTSFGASPSVYMASRARGGYRWLSPSRDGGFWATAWTNQYLIQRYSADGKLLLEFKSDRSWFPSDPNYWFPTIDRAPAPEMWAVHETADSLLWVIGRVADQNWRRGLRAPVGAEQNRVFPWGRYSDLFDGVVEVIDLRTRQVVVRQRFDQVFMGFTSPGVVVGVGEGSGGDLWLDVYELRMKGR